MFTNKDNIKLVVTDMDGTFLDAEGKLPEKAFEVIRELKKNGVMFVPASGRQYFNIHNLFLPVKDDVIIIAENGGVTFQDNMLIGSIPIETDWHVYLDAIDQIPGAFSVLSCVDKSYIKDVNMDFLKNVTNYYRRFEVVPDYRYINKEVIKLSACDLHSAERYIYPHLEKFKDQVQVKVSSDEWVDLNALNCNKGVAISNLQKSFDISKDETMVFGDFLNDYEMLSEAKYSYAMRNAHPKLKEAAKFEAPSNAENGVIKIIEERFGIKADEL